MTDVTKQARVSRRQPLLFGRERERDLLREHLSAAIAGDGGLILVGGEAGIGKTVLVEALARDAHERDVLVLTGHCYDLTTTPPYGPWVEALANSGPGADRPPLALRPGDQPDETLSQAALFQQVGDFLAALGGQQPLLLLLEDLHWADEASLDLLRYIARRAGEQHLLLVVTYRTDEVLRQLPLNGTLPLLIREAHGTRVDLRRLDSSAVDQLVAARYGLAASDRRQLVAYLDELGGGNPLYIDELLRTLEAERQLRPSGDGWSLGDLGAVRVPPLLRHLIDRRLGQLSAATRDALAVAAVVGQDVPIDLWSALAGVTPDQLADIVDESLTVHVLEELPDGTGLRFSHALIREAIYESLALPRRRIWHRRVAEALTAPTIISPDTVAYHFQQAGDERAIEWHVRAGLQARRTAWINAAHHFETVVTLMEGDQTREGERGWLRFYAASLLRFSGNPQSIRLLDAAEQTAISTGDRVLAAYACYTRGSHRCMRGDIHRGLRDIKQGMAAIDVLLETQHVSNVDAYALAVIQRLLPSGEAGRDSQDTTPQQDAGRLSGVNPSRGILINWLGKTGRYDEAIAVGQAYIDDIHATFGDEYLKQPQIVGGLLGLGHAYGGLGRPDDARQAFAHIRVACYALGDYAMVEDSIAAELLMALIPYGADQIAERDRLVTEDMEAWDRCRGITIATAGDGAPGELPLDLLEGRWRKARQLATHHLPAPWITQAQEAIVTLGVLDRHRGEPDRAWERVTELLPQGPATDPGDSYFAHAITGVALAAELALDADDLITARHWIEAHGRWLDWSGASLWRADTQLLWARWHERSGNVALAWQHAEAALTLASDPRQPLRIVAAHRLLGRLATRDGQYDRAAADLDQSLTLAGACNAPFERALTLLALAELRVVTGQRAAARTLLDEVRAICMPLDARPTLERVGALEATITSGTSATVAHPNGLTTREVEVLRLIVAGHSNRRIADTLFISPRTIERHIANIYLKIDAHNKAEATAYARDHHLA